MNLFLKNFSCVNLTAASCGAWHHFIADLETCIGFSTVWLCVIFFQENIEPGGGLPENLSVCSIGHWIWFLF